MKFNMNFTTFTLFIRFDSVFVRAAHPVATEWTMQCWVGFLAIGAKNFDYFALAIASGVGCTIWFANAKQILNFVFGRIVIFIDRLEARKANIFGFLSLYPRHLSMFQLPQSKKRQSDSIVGMGNEPTIWRCWQQKAFISFNDLEIGWLLVQS